MNFGKVKMSFFLEALLHKAGLLIRVWKKSLLLI